MLIKICGITNRADAEAAVAMGAGAIGLNFWPSSPRWVTPQAAAELARDLPRTALRVGVFVNAEANEIAQTVQTVGLDIVQLHGDSQAPPGIPLWRALAVNENFDPALLDDPAAEAFLLDSPSGERRGGTGRAFDWNLVRGLKQRIVLAGGLEAGNVAAAIEAVRPWGVDACSRLESSPGKKDHQKMAAFIAAAQATCT